MQQQQDVILEKQTQAFIDQLAAANAPPIYTLSPQEARKVLEDVQSKPIDKIDVDIATHNIAFENETLAITIYRPKNSAAVTLPVAMFFHGGGWILGSANTHDRLIRQLADGANIAVIYVNYTPSPEAQFPKAIEQAYAATKHIINHCAQYNLDASRLALIGDSVGGNMTIAVSLLMKERKDSKAACQILFYPVTSGELTTESYKQFANGPWLTKKAMEWFWNAYAPNSADRLNILASPLRATEEELKNLPPALIITDENDVLRDEGEEYGRKLMQAGVSVAAVRFLGTFHDFVMLNPLADTPAAQKAIALAVAYLASVLNKPAKNT